MTTMLEKPTTTPTPAIMANVDPALTKNDMYQLPPEKVQAELGQVATREEFRYDTTDQPNMNELQQFDTNAELATAAVVDKENDEKVSNELDGFSIVDTTLEKSSDDDTQEGDEIVPQEIDELPEGLDLGEPDNDEVDQ